MLLPFIRIDSLFTYADRADRRHLRIFHCAPLAGVCECESVSVALENRQREDAIPKFATNIADRLEARELQRESRNE